MQALSDGAVAAQFMSGLPKEHGDYVCGKVSGRALKITGVTNRIPKPSSFGIFISIN